MIKKIKIVSKQNFYSLCQGLHLNDDTINEQISSFRKFVVISIANKEPSSESEKNKPYANGRNTHLFKKESPYILNLEFGDYTQEDEDAFTLEDAKKIKDFIIPFIESEENIFLVIHCSAGLSRSFTVGESISDYINYKLEYKPNLEASIMSSSNILIKRKMQEVFYVDID